MTTQSLAPLRVQFAHGLESGPNGSKVRYLKTVYSSVTAPDMNMSLGSLSKQNSIARNALRLALVTPPWRLAGAAVSASLDACIAVHTKALREGEGPDVLVGSSWGGLVAAHLLASGVWAGPTVLLCPAVKAPEHYGQRLYNDGHRFDSVVARLADLPESVKERVVVVHGTADDTVAYTDSKELSERAGLELITVKDGSHRLETMMNDGSLVAAIRRATDGPSRTAGN